MTVTTRTLAEVAHDRLRTAILDGTLPDGSAVNQVALAREYGMSRVPIREAVQRLIAEGLLVATSHHSATVAVVGPAEVAELVDIREELEVLAVKRFSRRAGDPVFEHAAQVNELLADATDDKAAVALDLQFHSLLMNDMPSAAAIVLDIRKRTQKYIERLHVEGSPRPNGAAEHASVLAAIGRGDLDQAAIRMRQHINRTRRLLADAAHG